MNIMFLPKLSELKKMSRSELSSLVKRAGRSETIIGPSPSMRFLKRIGPKPIKTR
jgi:hypothetical protein